MWIIPPAQRLEVPDGMRLWPSSTYRYCMSQEKKNTVADCMSRWAYPASKGVADVSAHGKEEETKEAKRIIKMDGLMEEEGVRCFVVVASKTDTADLADWGLCKIWPRQ